MLISNVSLTQNVALASDQQILDKTNCVSNAHTLSIRFLALTFKFLSKYDEHWDVLTASSWQNSLNFSKLNLSYPTQSKLEAKTCVIHPFIGILLRTLRLHALISSICFAQLPFVCICVDGAQLREYFCRTDYPLPCQYATTTCGDQSVGFHRSTRFLSYMILYEQGFRDH